MNEYQKKVLQGRKEFLRLVQKQNRELLNIYIKASKQISCKLYKANAGSLTARYLSELDKALKQYVSELIIKLSKSTKAGIKASAEIASAVQLSYFDMIAPREDIRSTFNKMFTNLPIDITRKLIGGNYYEDGKTLDKRLWNIANKNAKDIDALIKVNVAKGANARELARELDSYINPMSRITPKTLQAGMSKKISYQAQRLARTSLTHASTETYIQGSKMNPFNKGLKWNLSPSHFQRMHGKTDICDEYAEQVFKPNEYPVAHCNCLCYPTQENIPIEDARDELIEWLNEKGNTKLDKWLENYGEDFGININEFANFDKSNVSKEVNSGIIDNKKWLEANFSSEKKFNRHIEKHLNEYGTITEKEYLNIARNLLAEPLSKDVEGFISKENFIFKYRNSTNDFAIGRADGYISTLYKPIKGYEQWLEEIEKYKKED
ncbi:hypothetical protein Z962_p0047 (plasmid) [Clostridium botulinum C/D str. BKT12695]|nr:hypothetical protein Z962_p0047 [Clostridium botulinum C/D str. BKT12695]